VHYVFKLWAKNNLKWSRATKLSDVTL